MNHVDANCNNKTYLKRSHSYTYISGYENLKNISAMNLLKISPNLSKAHPFVAFSPSTKIKPQQLHRFYESQPPK